MNAAILFALMAASAEPPPRRERGLVPDDTPRNIFDEALDLLGAPKPPKVRDGKIPAKTARRRAKKLQQARALAREGERE